MTKPSRLPALPVIDWFQVLTDLKRAGLSTRAVAALTEAGQATVVGWKNLGVEPRHGDGERLIQIWCRATGLGRDRLPQEAKAGERPARPIHPVPDKCPCCGDPYTPRVKRASMNLDVGADQSTFW